MSFAESPAGRADDRAARRPGWAGRRPGRPESALGTELAVADGVGRKHAEQVEVGRFLVLEEPDLVPRLVGRAEHLVAAPGPDQAHGPVDLLVDRVRGLRDRGQVE